MKMVTPPRPRGTPPQRRREHRNGRKAKIAFGFLDSDKTNPAMEEVSTYKNSSSLEEALKKMEQDVKRKD